MSNEKGEIKRCRKSGKWIPSGGQSDSIMRGQKDICDEMNRIELKAALKSGIAFGDFQKDLLDCREL